MTSQMAVMAQMAVMSHYGEMCEGLLGLPFVDIVLMGHLVFV